MLQRVQKAKYAVMIFRVLLSCGSASAQVLYGSLTGNVSDPSRSAIAGAKVEAVNVGTGAARSASTDERGAYLFTNLQPGAYKVSVTAPSFQSVVENNVMVNANDVRRADFLLRIVATSETIEVSAAATTLQTDKADVHEEIGSQQVEELPYNGGQGRNFQSLLYLIPGAGIPATPEANSDAGNPQRAQTLFMNGVSSRATARSWTARRSPTRGCRSISPTYRRRKRLKP